MRKRVNQATFEEIINNGTFIDKTYAKNNQVILGYQYQIKEFDFIQWIETGRLAKVRVKKILSPITSDTFNAYRANNKYRFFEMEVVEVIL